jgi:hypothetical protein
MPNPRQIRAAVGEEFKSDLEDLGAYLGHNSISQTIEFILKTHLKSELALAKQYAEQRAGKAQKNKPQG